MTGDMIPARRAYEVGLVNRIYPNLPWKKKREPSWTSCGNGLLWRSACQEGCGLGVGLDKMTHMEIEAYVQSLLITAKDFPATLKEGWPDFKEKGILQIAESPMIQKRIEFPARKSCSRVFSPYPREKALAAWSSSATSPLYGGNMGITWWRPSAERWGEKGWRGLSLIFGG